jgi:hypothetical protein
MNNVTGKTKTGFEYEIDADCLQDAEFLEMFAAVSKGGNEALQVFDLIRTALGDEQKKALYEHCRGENGRVMITDLTAEISDIFKALGENPETKN